jgi:hypothetical protein
LDLGVILQGQSLLLMFFTTLSLAAVVVDGLMLVAVVLEVT